MSWLRIDDKFAHHPKILELTDREFRVHVMALCYAAEYDTNGTVPRSTWKTLSITTKIARRLVEIGLWDDEETIHDFRRYNPVDPTSAERKRRYRERQGNGEGTEEERSETSRRNGPHARARAPVPVPSPSLNTNGRSTPPREAPPTPPLPIDKQDEILRLLDAIGDHADAGTLTTLRTYAQQLPVAALAKVRESLTTTTPRDRAEYAVGGLRSELAGRQNGRRTLEPEPEL